MTILFGDPVSGETAQGVKVPAGRRLILQPFFRETPAGRRFAFPPRVIPLPSPSGSGAKNANRNSDVEIDFDVVSFGKKKKKNRAGAAAGGDKYIDGTGSAVKTKAYAEGATTESLREFWERVREEQLEILGKTHDEGVAKRLAAVEAAIQTLDVEFSDRYTPKKGWRCNVYATDMLSLVRPVFDAYLPKQWWNYPRKIVNRRDSFESLIENGDGTHAQEEGAVNRWLHKWGPHFGWRQLKGRQSEVLSEGQDLANEGRLVVYSWADYKIPAGKDKDGNTIYDGFGGHLGLIVAETDAVHAKRYGKGGVRMPVVSQAGVFLYDRKVKGFNLQEKEKYGGSPGVFVHEPKNDESRFGPEVVSLKHKAAEIRPGRMTPSD